MIDACERTSALRTSAAWLGLLLGFGYFGYRAWGWVQYWDWYRRNRPFGTDLAIYYANSIQGLRFGWSRLYDLSAQHAAYASVGPLLSFPDIDPPPMAWLVAPLTEFKLAQAYEIWSGLLLAAFVGAVWLTAPDNVLAKGILASAALLTYPVVLGFILGQPVVLEMAAVAVAYRLLRRDRQVPAGLVLAIIVIHPQDILLVPLVLLVLGRWRALVAMATACLLVGAISFFVLGWAGVHMYLERVLYAQAHPDVYMVSVSYSLPLHFDGAARYLVVAAVVSVVCAVAWRHRSRGLEVPLAGALIGSLLVSSYIHLYDYIGLLVASWLVMRTGPSPFHWCVGAFAYWLLYENSFGQARHGKYLLLFAVVWLFYLVAFRDEDSFSPLPRWPALSSVRIAVGRVGVLQPFVKDHAAPRPTVDTMKPRSHRS